jgi:holo-[acyl-carrier protein] synthase
MSLKIGIDLVPIEKIAKNIKHKAFRKKVFTPDEIEICETSPNKTKCYAGKFAAKEAFMKAIGKGIRQEIWFTQIEVLNEETNAPYIQVYGKAKKSLSNLGVEHIHISIAHTNKLAVAMVVLAQ